MIYVYAPFFKNHSHRYVHSCQLWRNILLEILAQSKQEHTPHTHTHTKTIKSIVDRTKIETFFQKIKNRKTLRQISILNNIPFDLSLITLTLNLTLTYLTLPLCIYNTLTQWRSKLDNWAASIHIFMFTDHQNNRFENKLTVQNTNIWICTSQLSSLLRQCFDLSLVS